MSRFKLRSAKPFVLPLQIFGNVVFYSFFCETLIFKTFWQTARADGGRLATDSVHALCVFLCTPSLIAKWEPLEETSVREKQDFGGQEPQFRKKDLERLFCILFFFLFPFGGFLALPFILKDFKSSFSLCRLLSLHFSLTEVSSKGSHFGSKRGVHRNTHKAWSNIVVAQPPIAVAVSFSLVFVYLKAQNKNYKKQHYTNLQR